MSSAAFQQSLDPLLGCGPLKVWSVVVTIFGDFSETRDARIGGRVLDLLVGRMGITNQALRVALHRLRRDGWIEAEKQGRTSNYFLTEQGWSMSSAVRPIIYGAAIDRSVPLRMAVAPPTLAAPDIADALPVDALIVAPRCAILAGPDDPPGADWLISDFSVNDIPEWVRGQLCDADLAAAYGLLARTARGLQLPPETDLVDRSVLRLLTLHHWRRLRLRHGPLPDLLLPPDWAGAQARAAVLQVLQALPRPSLADLQTAYERENGG